MMESVMRSSLATLLAVLFIAGAALAQPASTAPPARALAALGGAADDDNAPHVQRQGAVMFVSGGVGEEGLSAMRQLEPGYNLRLLFARQGTGEYLADVAVRLVDANGNAILAATSDGPLFYARLSPGRYTLTVASENKSQTRPINVAAAGAVAQSFYWP
jgi:hypothetical protein